MFTEERALWLYEHFRWLEAHLPSRDDYVVPLILPTAKYFPMKKTGDHAFAQAVFDAVRDFMGLRDWVCVLEPQEGELHDREAELARRGGLFGPTQYRDAAGTFHAGDAITITYSPSLLHDPAGLVATLAHELCHYLLATVKEEPPCGWAEHEPLTDLAAVHEGFGVFLCNSAFHFGQWSDAQYSGWQYSRRGYLNEAELGFALGVFCVRRGIAPELAMPHLKQNPSEVFWDSIGYIEELEQQHGTA